MYGLLDCNNFYASCERAFNPNYENKPVVVLSNNDGCAIARSNEAKPFIPMGAPIFKYKEIIKKQGIIVLSANFELYGSMSNRVMNIIKESVPNHEIYSIDEAFMNFISQEPNALAICQDLQKKILKWLGLPVSIGLAKTKGLAKVANKIAKKYSKETGGVYTIDTEEKRIKALKWLPIGDVWGIGRQIEKSLASQGIKRAYDFTQMPSDQVQKLYSVVGWRLQQELLGIETLKLEETAKKKSIACTRTFEADYTDYDKIASRISTFAAYLGNRLRAQNSVCQSLTLFLYTNQYKLHKTQKYNDIKIKLALPTNSDIELVEQALKALKSIYQPELAYKRAGLIANELTSADTRQGNLLISDKYFEKQGRLMAAADKINNRYGKHSIRLLVQDSQQWRMRQEHITQRFTTRLDEVIKVV